MTSSLSIIRSIASTRPAARRAASVRRVHFVNEHDLVTAQAQFVLRVDQDQAALGREFGAPGEQPEADVGAPVE